MKLIKSALVIFIIFLLTAGCSDEINRITKPLRSSDYGSLKAKKAEQNQLKALELQPPAAAPDAVINGAPGNCSGAANAGTTANSDSAANAGMTSNCDDAANAGTIGVASYNTALSRMVSSIPGVGDARVFTANGHAYIALVLDNTGQGMLKSKPSGEREIGTRNSPLTAQSSIHNNPFRFFLTVNDNSQLSDRFVRTVTEAVKEKQPDVQSVHISANKDFMYYMDEFAQVVWGGESLEPYAEQFNILITHQFFSGKVMPTSLKDYRNLK